MTAHSRSSRQTDRLIQRNRTFSKPPWREALIAGGFDPIPNTAELLRQQIAANKPVFPQSYTGRPFPNGAHTEGITPMRAGGNGWFAWVQSVLGSQPTVPLLQPYQFDVRSFAAGQGSFADQGWTAEGGTTLPIPADGELWDVPAGEVISLGYTGGPLPQRPNAADMRLALSAGLELVSAGSGSYISLTAQLSDGAKYDSIGWYLQDGTTVQMVVNGVNTGPFAPPKASHFEVQMAYLRDSIEGGQLQANSRTDDFDEFHPGEPEPIGPTSRIAIYALGPCQIRPRHFSAGAVAYLSPL